MSNPSPGKASRPRGKSSAKPSARPSARISSNTLYDFDDWKAASKTESVPSGRNVKKRQASSGRKKMSAAKRRRRRRKIRTTLILLFVLAVCAAAGFGAVYLLRGGNLVELELPYSISDEFTNSLTRKEELRAVPFASDLCVVSGDVPLETASLGADQHGLLIDMDRETAVYALKAHEKIYPASITKIMTALLALKHGDLDETVTITQEDLNLEDGAQVCGFIAGDQVSLEQLLNCLLVYSGNDAAAAIARTIGGNETDFVSMMNQYAAQLGCTGTHFTNPHGLQDENHYTTAYDIYLMLNEAYQYPVFTKITQLSGYTVQYRRSDGTQVSTYLEATDHYLTGDATAPKDVIILGGKTGTTTEAGNCLALLCQNAYGHPFASIVLGATTKDVLYQEMNSLLQAVNDSV